MNNRRIGYLELCKFDTNFISKNEKFFVFNIYLIIFDNIVFNIIFKM